MIEIPNLHLFVAASVVLLLVPGPAVLYIMATGAQKGRKAGLVSVAGIHLGTMAHVAAAVLGLSAIIAASAAAFTALKLGGAAYLVFLGVRTIRRGSRVVTKSQSDSRSLRRVFADGVIVNVLNPKTALFFLAFVPQFVEPSLGNAAIQLVTLGLVFTVLGVITDSMYAIGAGWLGEWFQKRPTIATRQHWAAGFSYISLGIAAAASSNK